MGKLYEINQELTDLFAFEWSDEHSAWIYPDTGEFLTDEEFEARAEKLGMDKQRILEWMAKEILNGRSEAEALKAEVQRLSARKKSIEARCERLLAILDRECGGRKTDLGVATMSYRKSSAVVWDDSNSADIICWLEEHGHDDCLKYSDPEIRKMELKKLMASGVSVPFAEIEERMNGSLK
jgi:hypothetical protein